MKRFLTLLLLPLCLAAASEEIPIWPGDAPGTEGRPNEEYISDERIRKVHQPSLTVHLPPRELATGAGALICVGGGYGHLAIFKEGHHVASWLNTLGVAAFVLKYRLDREEAAQDALQAMRVIRERGADWGVDPARLGAFGFSAGGHLVLNMTARADDATRANFLVILYPAIRDLELGSDFARNAAPSFIAGASDDTVTPPELPIRFYQAVVAAGLPAELHLYRTGGHGFGLGLERGPVIDWTDRCEVWLRAQGYLTRSAE